MQMIETLFTEAQIVKF